MQAEITLRQAAQQALEALKIEQAALEYEHGKVEHIENAITALRAALAEPEQEPDGISWLKRDSGYFTAPTPRKPLTDEQIDALAEATGTKDVAGITYFTGKKLIRDFARAIERAHGITGETK